MVLTTKMNNKSTRGRQRIEIKQIEKQSNKEVTFSKRRAGLFRKASELCVLCGAEVGIIVLSPAKKPFSFGHPSIETIVTRYLAGNTSETQELHADTESEAQGAPSTSTVLEQQEVNEQYEKALAELESEKKRSAANKGVNRMTFWWDNPVENVKLEQMPAFLAGLQETRKKVASRISEMTRVRAACYPVSHGAVPGQFDGVSFFHGEFDGGYGFSFD